MKARYARVAYRAGWCASPSVKRRWALCHRTDYHHTEELGLLTNRRLIACTGGLAASLRRLVCVANGASWGLMAKQVNQYCPFTFAGAEDDPTVYAALKELATAPR
jgi:hypothetical protein